MTSYYLRSLAALLMLASDANAVLDYHVPKNNNIAESYANQLAHHSKSATVLKSDIAEYSKMVQVDVDDGLLFYWNVDNEFLDMRVVYDGNSWLGFGVVDGANDLSEVIIGKPRSKHFRKNDYIRKYDFLGHSWKNAEKMKKKHQTLSDMKFIQTDTSTTMSFKKLLKDKNNETVINPSGDNTFIFAFGKGNTLHDPKGSFFLKLDLTQNSEDAESKDKAISKDKPTSKDEAVLKPASEAKRAFEAKYPNSKDEEAPKGKKSAKNENTVESDETKNRALLTLIMVFSSAGAILLIMMMNVVFTENIASNIETEPSPPPSNKYETIEDVCYFDSNLV